MNSSLASDVRDQSSAARNSKILIVYTAAIFVSALLLFSVQPLFTKMVLPRLGGSPAVWSVAMVFFQSLLLFGYAYAHYLMTLRNRTAPVAIHLALLVVAALTLPLSIAANWGDPPATGTPFWLLGLFAVSIGLPFFALAANNPMLQAWFVRTGHPDGPDPYFLYASSNIGSFLALLSYPLLFEPVFTLRTQNWMWTGGYVLLIVLIGACGALLLKSPPYVPPAASAVDAAAPSWSLRLRWIFLAAVPSGLLVAVTAHISTDVAAAPLLWVLPLSLYLLTWVLVFQSRPLIPHNYVMLLQPLAVGGVVYLMAYGGERNLALTLGGHLLAFFVIALSCHGELARTRPSAQHLTGFYVALSFGGMVGGLFAGLIAPFVFSWIAEYPILAVLAMLCRPKEVDVPPLMARIAKWVWLLVPIGLAVAIVPYLNGGSLLTFMRDHMISIAVGIAAATVVLILLVRADRYSAAALIAIALMIVRFYPSEDGKVETVRSFFGVHKIVTNADGAFRVLMHGTTIHGAQRLLNADGTKVEGPPEMITYYHSVGGIGGAIDALREMKGGGLRAAVIGLGAGTLTCQHRQGEDWKFFEIDQSMIDTARDPKYFTFIRDCYPDVKPVLGDARLTFAKEPDGVYDIIVVDAYSSDAIPIHLATREAMAIYKRKLAPNGVVIMHVSNRHLELSSVIVGIADANGLKSWVFSEDANRDSDYIFATTVVISAREEADIGKLNADDKWTLTEAKRDRQVWTDDYSNVLGAVMRRLKDGEE